MCALFGCSNQAAKTPQEFVEQIEKSLKELPFYSTDLEVALDISVQGQEQNMDAAFDVVIEKPNRWAIVRKSGMMGGTSISDGEQVTTYIPTVDSYVVEKLSDETIPSLDDEQSLMILGAGSLAQIFQGEGLEKFLLQDTKKSKLLPSEVIDGIEYQVASFERENGTQLKLWANPANHMLVRRVEIVPDVSKIAPPGQADSVKIVANLDFTDWDLEKKPADDDFVFTPPEGAKKAKSLAEALTPKQPPHPLLGESAPEFTVKDLEGNEVSLASYKDKDAVILDFWSTWCGPCTAALPIISKVAGEFADKNVTFYAVNVGESPDVIKEFLTESKLNVPVLLDEDSSISELYGVSGIPQTVLIDKTGRIQVVHVGFGGDLEQKLTQELNDILAGKDLATAELEEYEGGGEEESAEPTNEEEEANSETDEAPPATEAANVD
jgi:peroxiredoxin/outer membrane lipoprotein-sorting protein